MLGKTILTKIFENVFAFSGLKFLVAFIKIVLNGWCKDDMYMTCI